MWLDFFCLVGLVGLSHWSYALPLSQSHGIPRMSVLPKAKSELLQETIEELKSFICYRYGKGVLFLKKNLQVPSCNTQEVKINKSYGSCERFQVCLPGLTGSINCVCDIGKVFNSKLQACVDAYNHDVDCKRSILLKVTVLPTKNCVTGLFEVRKVCRNFYYISHLSGHDCVVAEYVCPLGHKFDDTKRLCIPDEACLLSMRHSSNIAWKKTNSEEGVRGRSKGSNLLNMQDEPNILKYSQDHDSMCTYQGILPLDCYSYIICLLDENRHFRAYIKRCPEGLRFSKFYRRCIIPQNAQECRLDFEEEKFAKYTKDYNIQGRASGYSSNLIPPSKVFSYLQKMASRDNVLELEQGDFVVKDNFYGHQEISLTPINNPSHSNQYKRVHSIETDLKQEKIDIDNGQRTLLEGTHLTLIEDGWNTDKEVMERSRSGHTPKGPHSIKKKGLPDVKKLSFRRSRWGTIAEKSSMPSNHNTSNVEFIRDTESKRYSSIGQQNNFDKDLNFESQENEIKNYPYPDPSPKALLRGSNGGNVKYVQTKTEDTFNISVGYKDKNGASEARSMAATKIDEANQLQGSTPLPIPTNTLIQDCGTDTPSVIGTYASSQRSHGISETSSGSLLHISEAMFQTTDSISESDTSSLSHIEMFKSDTQTEMEDDTVVNPQFVDSHIFATNSENFFRSPKLMPKNGYFSSPLSEDLKDETQSSEVPDRTTQSITTLGLLSLFNQDNWLPLQESRKEYSENDEIGQSTRTEEQELTRSNESLQEFYPSKNFESTSVVIIDPSTPITDTAFILPRTVTTFTTQASTIMSSLNDSEKSVESVNEPSTESYQTVQTFVPNLKSPLQNSLVIMHSKQNTKAMKPSSDQFDTLTKEMKTSETTANKDKEKEKISGTTVPYSSLEIVNSGLVLPNKQKNMLLPEDIDHYVEKSPSAIFQIGENNQHDETKRTIYSGNNPRGIINAKTSNAWTELVQKEPIEQQSASNFFPASRQKSVTNEFSTSFFELITLDELAEKRNAQESLNSIATPSMSSHLEQALYTVTPTNVVTESSSNELSVLTFERRSTMDCFETTPGMPMESDDELMSEKFSVLKEESDQAEKTSSISPVQSAYRKPEKLKNQVLSKIKQDELSTADGSQNEPNSVYKQSILNSAENGKMTPLSKHATISSHNVKNKLIFQNNKAKDSFLPAKIVGPEPTSQKPYIASSTELTTTTLSPGFRVSATILEEGMLTTVITDSAQQRYSEENDQLDKVESIEKSVEKWSERKETSTTNFLSVTEKKVHGRQEPDVTSEKLNGESTNTFDESRGQMEHSEELISKESMDTATEVIVMNSAEPLAVSQDILTITQKLPSTDNEDFPSEISLTVEEKYMSSLGWNGKPDSLFGINPIIPTDIETSFSYPSSKSNENVSRAIRSFTNSVQTQFFPPDFRSSRTSKEYPTLESIWAVDKVLKMDESSKSRKNIERDKKRDKSESEVAETRLYSSTQDTTLQPEITIAQTSGGPQIAEQETIIVPTAPNAMPLTSVQEQSLAVPMEPSPEILGESAMHVESMFSTEPIIVFPGFSMGASGTENNTYVLHPASEEDDNISINSSIDNIHPDDKKELTRINRHS